MIGFDKIYALELQIGLKRRSIEWTYKHPILGRGSNLDANNAHLTSREAGLTLAGTGAGNLVALTVALADTLPLLADLLDTRSARALDVGSVSVVGVDANEVRNTLGLDTGDDNVPGTSVVGAVTAAAVKLASVDDSEVLDGDSTATVVLNDLVLCLLSTATLDEDVTASERRDGIYNESVEH